ncbi:MAG TPA: serine hydrolase, partial [Bacteroidales bacterium]|nr:serine hydrolase [Bacteroidales bacterium]
NMYLAASFRDSIFHRVLNTPLQKRRTYFYSDLGFILLADLIKQQSGLPLDKFMQQTFFDPMELATMTFNPLDKFEPTQIVPSQNDTLWRRQVVRGFVNDPAAAMLGGVSGHAGLFSNALDLAKLMVMFEQGGSYGGIQFVNPYTLREFTRVQFAGNQNRRGLGFDKPSIVESQPSPASKSASSLSFGHSGFTGTFAWVDPVENLVFVFLSNRTYPYTSNRKINTLDVRRSIQEAIYNALRYSESGNQPVTNNLNS